MNEVLHTKALQCVKNYKKSEKELIEVLQDIDHTKNYLYYGVSSLFRYCVEILRLSEDETYRLTQVSRKAVHVPQLKKAIEDGRLTVSKASRIAPILNQGNAELWIDRAVTMTQKEVEREIAKEKPGAVKKEQIKFISYDNAELRVNLKNDSRLDLKRLQQVLRAKNIEDTISYALEFTLQHKDPIRKAKRSMNKKTHPLPALRQVPTGKPLRTPVPSEIKHQINLRDKGACQYKNCREKHWVQVHHILPIALGGTNKVENLITLCSSHHKMLHKDDKPYRMF